MATAVTTVLRESTHLCNSRKRQGEGYCTRPAGWGTAHVGQGRCKLHGGNGSTASLQHGRYSRYLKLQLQEQTERFLDDPTPLDLLPELASQRAILEHLLQQPEALQEWDKGLDAIKSIEAIVKTVAHIEKIRSENAISVPDLTRMVGYFLSVVGEYVSDEGAMADIKRRIGLFRWASGAGKGQ